MQPLPPSLQSKECIFALLKLKPFDESILFRFHKIRNPFSVLFFTWMQNAAILGMWSRKWIIFCLRRKYFWYTKKPAHLPGGVIMSTKTKSALKLPLKQHNMHTAKKYKAEILQVTLQCNSSSGSSSSKAIIHSVIECSKPNTGYVFHSLLWLTSKESGKQRFHTIWIN